MSYRGIHQKTFKEKTRTSKSPTTTWSCALSPGRELQKSFERCHKKVQKSTIHIDILLRVLSVLVKLGAPDGCADAMYLIGSNQVTG